MKWNLLLASCLVAATILLMAGAPFLAVALGTVLGAGCCWYRHHRERRYSAKSRKTAEGTAD